MRERAYIDRLFAGYEDTPDIRDFKEEIAVNLRERIKELVSKGLDEQSAFGKAAAELGDVTAIADDAGRKKRNEAIGQMYMGARVPVTKRTAAGITAASGLLLVAAGMLMVAFLRDGAGAPVAYISAAALAAACGMYTYFGLTQETAAHYAMKNGRALAYGIVCLMGVLGAALSVVLFVLAGWDMSQALLVKIALILPAVCGLIFLLATESKRQKPWLKAMTEACAVNYSIDFSRYRNIVNPVKAAKFGVASGGLWILAVSVFIALGLIVGWRYSWLTFLFAAAIQVFMVTAIFEKER
jgi:MFS family permease